MPIDLDALVATPAMLTGGITYKGVLGGALELLSDQDRWTQKAHARDQCGNPVKPIEPSACCWCLLGAVARSSNEFGIIPPQVLRYLTEMMYYYYGTQFETLGEMNDYVSHDLILQFLQNCISQFE